MQSRIKGAIRSLRAKGYTVESELIYPVGPMRGRRFVCVNGIAMPYGNVYALDAGKLTLEQIATALSEQVRGSSAIHRPPDIPRQETRGEFPSLVRKKHSGL